MGFTIYDLRLTRKQTRLDKNGAGIRLTCEFVKIIRLTAAGIGLLLLCSCATIHPLLPADVTLNKDVARGNVLFVTLRLENGEELPFIVDTG